MKKFFLRLHIRYVIHSAHRLERSLGEKTIIVMLAIAIGVLTALAAGAMHCLVDLLNRAGSRLTAWAGEFSLFAMLAVFMLLPLAGIVLSFVVQRLFGGVRYAKSISPLIFALSRKRTSIPLSETVTHIFSSALSVGLGGSAGLEAPSVLTGAAVGANTGSFFAVAKSKRSLLLGCGSAGAIAAIFDSPIAGVLFAAEVLLPEFSVSALVPMLLSSAVSAVLSHVMLGKARFFLAVSEPWRADAIPYYFVCGFFCALAGVYVIRCVYWTADRLKKRFVSPWRRLFAGGGILALLLFLFPALRGQGYGYIGSLFAGDTPTLMAESTVLPELPDHPALLLSMLIAVILLKAVASVLTVESGGDGGIFAPSMFIGAVCGFVFARAVNLAGIAELQEYNFVAVGMCGVFTAVMRAPLTGIFLIAEVTGGYILLAPLMIVSSVSFLAARHFEPHSIYRKVLAEKKLLDDDRDISMLHQLPVRLNITHKYHALKATDHIRLAAEAIAEYSAEETFPVLDADGRLQGVVYQKKILASMLDMASYNHLLVFDLMEDPPEILSPDDDLARAMHAFDRSDAKSLPVCGTGRVFIGFVEKAPIFAKYRRLVKSSNSAF